MRIISGKAKGQRLFTPGRGRTVSPIRPTSDKVREAIFNIIALPGGEGEVLDLFAGTGAMGIEALSRGCGRALFIDRSSESVRLIRRNLEKCGFSEAATVLRHDIMKGPFFWDKFRPAAGFALIFADPPYGKGYSARVLELLGQSGMLGDGGRLIIEEARNVRLPDRVMGLALDDCRTYGDTVVHFYVKSGGELNDE